MKKFKKPKYFKRSTRGSGKVREKIGKKNKNKFPNNSRSIPDLLNPSVTLKDRWREVRPLDLLKIFGIVLLIGVIIFEGIDLYRNYQAKQKLESERKGIETKIAYWRVVVDKYRDYRDGYFQIALLKYRLGEIEKSRKYLQKTTELDPNFEDGKKLFMLVNNRD